jgi:hypothetical protein
MTRSLGSTVQSDTVEGFHVLQGDFATGLRRHIKEIQDGTGSRHIVACPSVRPKLQALFLEMIMQGDSPFSHPSTTILQCPCRYFG